MGRITWNWFNLIHDLSCPLQFFFVYRSGNAGIFQIKEHWCSNHLWFINAELCWSMVCFTYCVLGAVHLQLTFVFRWDPWWVSSPFSSRNMLIISCIGWCQEHLYPNIQWWVMSDRVHMHTHLHLKYLLHFRFLLLSFHIMKL